MRVEMQVEAKTKMQAELRAGNAEGNDFLTTAHIFDKIKYDKTKARFSCIFRRI